MLAENPCLHCGACCAHFRVSFYWGESDPGQGGSVPPDQTEDVTGFLRCMKGTNQKRPRCIALDGEIGQNVACRIYAQRPSPCRHFGIVWSRGVVRFSAEGLARCNQARAAWGLPPLHVHPPKHTRPRRRYPRWRVRRPRLA